MPNPPSPASRTYELRMPAKLDPAAKRANATASVEAWNATYEPGTKVLVCSGTGQFMRSEATTTTGKAFVLHGSTAVVPVECSASPWALTLVKPV